MVLAEGDLQLELDIVADLGVYVLRIVSQFTVITNGDLVSLVGRAVFEPSVGYRSSRSSKSGEGKGEDDGRDDGGEVEQHLENRRLA